MSLFALNANNEVRMPLKIGPTWSILSPFQAIETDRDPKIVMFEHVSSPLITWHVAVASRDAVFCARFLG